MFKIRWEEDDSIEKIAVNNNLDVQYVVDLFKDNNCNKGKTIAILELQKDYYNKKRQEYMNTPKYQQTMQNFNTLMSMASMLGYFDGFERYNDFINKPYQKSPKEFGQALKKKKR